MGAMATTAAAEADQERGAARSDRSRSRAARARARACGRVSVDWERYVADLRLHLDEVHAKLAFAERQLARTRGRAGTVLELAAGFPEVDAPPARTAGVVELMRRPSEPAVRGVDDPPSASSPVPTPVLDALGRDHGRVHINGRAIDLSRRHTEILVLLAAHPDGMTTEELALALYGETGRPASVRTELCRLRKALGQWIHNERKRVRLEIEADFLVVGRLLRAGRAQEAAQQYSTALLPHSEAPGVVDARDELDAWVRSAVMTSGDREALWAWLESGSGRDDVPAWKRFLADLDFDDPRRALAMSRLARLRSALTVVR
jgi:hypothetical protein